MRSHRLGQVPAGAFEEFFDILEEIVNEMYGATNNGLPYPIKVSAADGPVSDMIVKLRLMKSGRWKAAAE